MSKMFPTKLVPPLKYCLENKFDLDEFRKFLIEKRGLKFYTEEELKMDPPGIFVLASPERSFSNNIKYLMEEITGHFIADELIPAYGVPFQIIAESGSYSGSGDFVKIMKTHYPKFVKVGIKIPHPIKRAVVGYRDFIPRHFSVLNFVLNKGSQILKCSHEEFMQVKDVIREEIERGWEMHRLFYDYWLTKATIPILFCDVSNFFEDYKEVLTEMVVFLDLKEADLGVLERFKTKEDVLKASYYKPMLFNEASPKRPDHREILGDELYQKYSKKNEELKNAIFKAQGLFAKKNLENTREVLLPKDSDNFHEIHP